MDFSVNGPLTIGYPYGISEIGSIPHTVCKHKLQMKTQGKTLNLVEENIAYDDFGLRRISWKP